MRRLLLLLLVAAVLPYFLQLGASSIWDANEAYYVETPREMIERGDYVNPSFNYEPRFNKPVLSYWIVAALYNLFGVSLTVERAAIAGAAMVMLAATFVIARAASRHPLAPLLAVIGLAAGPRFFMFSRRILVDMAMTAMMTLILLFFVLAERYPARRRLFLMLMYACVGLGVLTKGPVAAVLPALVFLAYLATHRELSRVREMMIPTGALVALLFAAPWYVGLYAQHGWTYIAEFFIAENLGRYTDTVGTQVRGPLFYIPVVFTDSLPWSLFLPAVVAAWLREPRGTHEHRIRTILILWVGMTVLFFSFSQTKQDLYIFPIVGAIAALGADWIARALDDATAVAAKWFTGTMVTVGAVLVAAGAFVLYVFVSRSVYQLDGALMAGAVALAGGAAVAVTALGRHRVAAVLATLTALVAFNWVLLLRVLPSFEAYKPSVPLSDVIRRAAAPGDVVMHFDVAMPSMVYYLRRHIDITFDPEQLHRQIKSDRKVFAVLPAHRYPQLKIELGVPTCELARYPIGEVRLRDLLKLEPLPEIVLITNRCPTGTPSAAIE